MGCCFSKELNPSLQNERSSLLQHPPHDGLNEVTEQVRPHAVAVAQHVRSKTEDTCVVDSSDQKKPLEDEKKHPQVDNNVRTEAVVVNRDGTTQSERDLKPACTNEEKKAIIIRTSTNMHSNTDAEEDKAKPARLSSGPTPYMEMPSRSPVRQRSLENATQRPLGFSQLPDKQKQEETSTYLSSSACVPSDTCLGNNTVSEASDDHLPGVRVGQETQRHSPKAEHEDEEGTGVCVDTATLYQGFEARTRSFYSLCTFDPGDLENDHIHNQSQTAVATQSLRAAEGETAAPASVKSHTEASTACEQQYVTESKKTSQSRDGEPISVQSHAAQRSPIILPQTLSENSLSAEQNTFTQTVVSPLPSSSNQIHGETPLASMKDSPQPEDPKCQTAAQDTDMSSDDTLITLHTDQMICEKDKTVKDFKEILVREDCVHLENHRAAEEPPKTTEEAQVKSQEEEVRSERVDSDSNPLNHQDNSDLLTDQDIWSLKPAAAETPELDHSSPSKVDLSVRMLQKEESVLHLCREQTEVDKFSLQSKAVPVSICASHSEEGDVGHVSTADTNLTEVSSFSTSSAVSSLPPELHTSPCKTNLTPSIDTETPSHRCEPITRDNLDSISNNPNIQLSSMMPLSQDNEPSFTEFEHSDASFHVCDKTPSISDVKTEGGVVFLDSDSDGLCQDDRQADNRPKPDVCPKIKHVEKGDVTAVLPETAEKTSHFEKSNEKHNLLSEHCGGCMMVNTSLIPPDTEGLESSTEDSSVSPLTGPLPAESDALVPTSSPLSPHTSSEERLETEADSIGSECRQTHMKVDAPEKEFMSACEKGEETKAAQGTHIHLPVSVSISDESVDTTPQHLHTPQAASEPTEMFTSDCVNSEIYLSLQHDTADCSPQPGDLLTGIYLEEMDEMKMYMSQEEHSALDSDNLKTPEKALVLDCQEDSTMINVDPCQIDANASTPSYEIHLLGHEPSVTIEERRGEGGMREMVSELLGEDADSSVCRLYPHRWIKLGLEDSWAEWAQGASEAEPRLGECKTGTDSEQIPACVSELQPSMALLGAYPYSTVMPQGSCVWDWHTDCTQPVSVHGMTKYGLVRVSSIYCLFHKIKQ